MNDFQFWQRQERKKAEHFEMLSGLYSCLTELHMGTSRAIFSQADPFMLYNALFLTLWVNTAILIHLNSQEWAPSFKVVSNSPSPS